ncbi:MAG: 5-formyltetrahydrofolate cyclo-ligase [Marinifilaceae bacterium]
MKLIFMDKKELRHTVKLLKQQVTKQFIEENSLQIMANLEKTDAFKNAKNILCYWALPDEVQTQSFIKKWYKKKRIYLPCIDGTDLKIKPFEGENRMKVDNRFNVAEPTTPELTDLSVLDMIIVPGVAFDIMGNRMGRGKGYYDKLLQNIKAEKIGICFDFQLQAEVPVDAHDIPMNTLVTESEIFFLC